MITYIRIKIIICIYITVIMHDNAFGCTPPLPIDPAWQFVLRCAGVGFATRQVGNRTKPSLIINMDDQGMICVKSQSTFKTVEIKFKLNEPFEETTADDRKTMVGWDQNLCVKIRWFGWTGSLEITYIFPLIFRPFLLLKMATLCKNRTGTAKRRQ